MSMQMMLRDIQEELGKTRVALPQSQCQCVEQPSSYCPKPYKVSGNIPAHTVYSVVLLETVDHLIDCRTGTQG